MVVDFFNSSASYKTTATISDVDWPNNAIVTAADISSLLADNDRIYRAGTHSTSSGSFSARGFDGLEAATSASGTYLNISRASYPRWEGNTVAISGAIDEDVIERARIRVMQEGGISKGTMKDFKVLMHYNQYRKFAEVAYPRQRFAGTSVDFGVVNMSASGMEILDLPFCPETVVYAGDLSVFNHFATPNGDLQLSTDFGPAWLRVPGYDQGQAYLRAYDNYCVTNPRKWVAMTSLTDVTSR